MSRKYVTYCIYSQEAVPSEVGTADYDPQRQSSAAPSEATSYQRREQVEVNSFGISLHLS